MGSPWANVAISGKLDIYDTLLPGSGRKGLSDLFITALHKLWKIEQQVCFHPITRPVDGRLPFPYLRWQSGSWKLAPEVLCTWPHCYESKGGGVLTAITVIVPLAQPFIVHKASIGFILILTIALWGFCSLTHVFNQQNASYVVSASMEVGIIVVLPIYELVTMFIQQISFFIFGMLGLEQVKKIPKWTMPHPYPKGAHSCQEDADMWTAILKGHIIAEVWPARLT